MLDTLPLLASLGAAIVGGVFFAFSSFVMRALAQRPAAEGIAAMQAINRVVLNPGFLGVFVGTAVLAGICVLAGFFPWGEPKSALLLAAGLLYLLGCFGVTAACNVPRNERLARLDSQSAEAAAYWLVYRREWLRWNHVRTAAALLSAVCAAASAQAQPPVPRGAELQRALEGLWCNSHDGGRTCWAWDRFHPDGRFEACGRTDDDPRPFRGAGQVSVDGQRMCYVVSAASDNFWLPPGARYCTDIVAIDAATHRYRDIDTGAEFTLHRRPLAEQRCP